MLKPRVEVEETRGVLVAEFWDCLRLDPAPVQELRAIFESHVRRNKRPDLLIDLQGVGFAGSASLSGFVMLQRLVRQHGGRMIICQVDPTVLEAFRVSRLEPLFTFVAGRQEALASLGLSEPPTSDDELTAVTPFVTPTEPPAPSPPMDRGSAPLRNHRRKT